MKHSFLKLFKRCFIILLLFCFINHSGVNAVAQESSLLPAPKWEVGDWWIVESQLHKQCHLITGDPCPEKWIEPPIQFRFQVEGTDTLEGELYFVVSSTPLDTTFFTDHYRFWFRVSDRFIGRYERSYWGGKRGANGRLTQRYTARRDFDPLIPMPFVRDEFAWLPAMIPIFDVQQERTVFRTPRGGSPTSTKVSKYSSMGEEPVQDIQPIDAMILLEKAAPTVQQTHRSLLTDSPGSSVTIRSRKDAKGYEQQYWAPELPWYIYMESFEYLGMKNYPFNPYKRAWLVEVGHE